MQSKKKVFLGGTCNDSTWRNDLIQKLQIDGIPEFYGHLFFEMIKYIS